MAPTLFLQANDLGVGAEAVPRRAVVNSLEVGGDNVAHGEGGDDPFLGGHRLNGVTAGCSRLQHRLLPRPGLSEGKSVSKRLFLTLTSTALLWKNRNIVKILGQYELFMCVGLLKHLQRIWN